MIRFVGFSLKVSPIHGGLGLIVGVDSVVQDMLI